MYPDQTALREVILSGSALFVSRQCVPRSDCSKRSNLIRICTVCHSICFLFFRHLSRVMRKPTFWFLTWSDTNQAVQLLKMARGWKFRIYKVEGLYCLCSENKGADQLRGHRKADLRLCFRICKMLVFS